MATQPNVVLVVADTTRADDAYDPAVAPTLADLRRSGTTATRAFSTAPWTLPAHASLFTGTHSSKHGAHVDHPRLDDALPTLPGLFRAAGYETVGLSNNTWVSTEAGFGRGFETFRQLWQLVQSSRALGEVDDVLAESRARALAREVFDGNPLVNVANVLYHFLVRGSSEEGGGRTTAWIADWLADRRDDRPFFLFANYLEPHLDYRPPRRLAAAHLPDDVTYDEATGVPQQPWEYLAGTVSLSDRELRILRGLYRAEIAYFDEHLDRLREALVEAGEWEDTILVVAGDHGENVGHHGMMDHQYALYDSLIHVPLVLRGGAFDGGGEVDDLVSLVDLPPTLLDAANVDDADARAAFQGRSFHPDADASPRDFVVAEYMGPQPSMDALERNVGDLPGHVYELDRSLRAFRTAEHKLIRGSDGSTEVYDVAGDPDEGRDLAASRPALVESLGNALDRWLDGFEHADPDGSVTIDGERKARLEQLGYLQ